MVAKRAEFTLRWEKIKDLESQLVKQLKEAEKALGPIHSQVSPPHAHTLAVAEEDAEDGATRNEP